MGLLGSLILLSTSPFTLTSFENTSKNPVGYDDNFIKQFLSSIFPKFPHDLLIKILSLLSVQEILIIQSLLNDVYIKGLRIKRITNRREIIKFPARRIQKITSNERRLVTRYQKKKRKLIQLFKTISQLIKASNKNIIPIKVDFRNSKHFAYSLLNSLINNSKNYDIELVFGSSCYFKCKKLEEYKYSSYVTSIVLSRLSSKRRPEIIDLDLSTYPNLKKFHFNDERLVSLKMDSSFETLIDLSIPAVFDDCYLTRLINLKYLTIDMDNEKDVKIKDLPRNINSLILSSFGNGTGVVIISSGNDWPQFLTSLTLSGSLYEVFEDVIIYNLPPELISLEIDCYAVNKFIPILPQKLQQILIGSGDELVNIRELFVANLQYLHLPTLA